MSTIKSKEELGLYLPPEVLRLPYPLEVRAVLAEVRGFCDKGKVCIATDKHFTERLGVSRNTASRAVQRLVADGLLQVKHIVIKGRLRRVLTPLNHQLPTNGSRATSHVASPGSDDEDVLPLDGAPPLDGAYIPDRVQPPNGARDSPQMGHEAAPGWGTNNTIKKAEKEEPKQAASPPGRGERFPQKEMSKSTRSRSAPPLAEPPGFAEFYDAWPNKQNRRAAAKAFAALSGEDRRLATESADKWVREHSNLVERGSCPYPSSWLNGARWTDGPEPPNRQPYAAQSTVPPPVRASVNAGDIIRRQNAEDLR